MLASSAEIAATGSNVGTMLGLKAKEIGTTWNYAEGVTVRLNKLIVADPADPDDPLHETNRYAYLGKYDGQDRQQGHLGKLYCSCN